MFIDAIMVKIRDGQVRNQPIYAAIGVDLDNHKDILGMWPVTATARPAKFWLAVLTDLKNRGVRTSSSWSATDSKACRQRDQRPSRWQVQTCIIHLIRNNFPVRLPQVLGQDQCRPQTDLHRHRPRGGTTALREFAEKWGKPYPAIKRLWDNAWEEFIPFLDYDVEIRRVLYSTNAIDGRGARYRRGYGRGHFPNEQSALKTLYLVTRSLDPKVP